MSDTMWVNVNEVIKSYKAAGIECQIMSDKRVADTLICKSGEQETFSKWHDISVGLGVEVEEDFFKSYPQTSTAQLARDVEFLQKNYDGARKEIEELKNELGDKNWQVRKFKHGHEERLAEFKEMQAKLAKETKAFSNLYSEYSDAKDEILELKKELSHQKMMVSNGNKIHRQRVKEFMEYGESMKEVISERDSCGKMISLLQTANSRLRQLCGEAADWMKNEIIHESEAETALREELHMQSHR